MRSHKRIRVLEAFALPALIVFVFLSSIFFVIPVSAGQWADDQAKLQGYVREIDDLQERLKHQIHEKKHTDEKEAVKRLVDQIAENYKKLKKASKDHEALWLHIRFKHPEQAQTLEKRYTRFKLKSLEDMEAEVGIDGRLDRVKSRVMATFPAPVLVEEKKDDSKVHPFFRRPASVDDDAIEEIKLSK